MIRRRIDLTGGPQTGVQFFKTMYVFIANYEKQPKFEAKLVENGQVEYAVLW